MQLIKRHTDPPHQNANTCTYTHKEAPVGEKKLMLITCIMSASISIRLMLYSYVTFCLQNILHPGFGELNLPYEYEVIEKYIPASSHD